MSVKRATDANPETMDKFISLVEKLLLDTKILYEPDLAERLWNCDECGLSTGITSKKILAKRGAKWVHDTAGGSDHTFITVNGCGSASGNRLPPFVLYKGKHLYTAWMKNGPEGTKFGVSDSGWMEENFHSWFSSMFIPKVIPLLSTGPVVLFLDGHHSHLSIELLLLAREKKVHIICLPPNTTHVLQPLDVGVYAPVKQAWRAVLREYKLNTRASNVDKEVFPKLLSQL